MPDAVPDPAAPFVLDTSCWIEWFAERYRPTVFASLWDHVPHLLTDGRIVLAHAAYMESTKRDNDLKRWMYAHHERVHPNNQSIEAGHASIQAHPMGVALVTKGAAGVRSDGDSRIIATAMFLRGTVVSKEEPSTSPTRPKIPNVCHHFRVPCIKLMDMFELLQLRY